jgi:hypothetical protein
MATLPNRAICHKPSFLLFSWRGYILSAYLYMCGRSVMYIERSMRGAKDPYGSFACSVDGSK